MLSMDTKKKNKKTNYIHIVDVSVLRYRFVVQQDVCLTGPAKMQCR